MTMDETSEENFCFYIYIYMIYLFISIKVFFHDHSRITGPQGKERVFL